ncbi:MAG TPA: Uma2 family endonuclease [Polyangiaceae bacterium]|nr:Uma2 family endonuclease [Polyangiaceae bacterium]
MTFRLPTPRRGERRYLREPVPLVFPTDEEVPEHKLHVELRTALYQLIQLALGDHVIVGTEQFVYFDAANPQRRLAPDVMVWVGAKDEIFGAWKVWERGAPHVAVEIVSPSDKPPGPWKKKLERYQQCGVSELVRFDPEAKSERLRIWDRVDGDLVERDVTAANGHACDALGLWWCVSKDPTLGLMLRLSRDSAGAELLPTLAEARLLEAEARTRMEAEKQRAEAEKQRAEAEKQRAEAEKDAAEARVRALEAELERAKRS